MVDYPFEYFLNSNVLNVQGYTMNKYMMEHLDVIHDSSKLNIQYQLDLMKVIDNHTTALNSTRSIAPEGLDKAHPTMGWFPKYLINCNFAATKQLDNEVVYSYRLRNNTKSRYPYLKYVILNDN